MSTLEQMEAARAEERDKQLFQLRMDEFLRRFRPHDHREAVDFERELIMLIRQVYRDAQQPLLDHIVKMANRAGVPY